MTIRIRELLDAAELAGLHLTTGELLRQQIIIQAIRRDFEGQQ